MQIEKIISELNELREQIAKAAIYHNEKWKDDYSDAVYEAQDNYLTENVIKPIREKFGPLVKEYLYWAIDFYEMKLEVEKTSITDYMHDSASIIYVKRENIPAEFKRNHCMDDSCNTIFLNKQGKYYQDYKDWDEPENNQLYWSQMYLYAIPLPDRTWIDLLFSGIDNERTPKKQKLVGILCDAIEGDLLGIDQHFDYRQSKIYCEDIITDIFEDEKIRPYIYSSEYFAEHIDRHDNGDKLYGISRFLRNSKEFANYMDISDGVLVYVPHKDLYAHFRLAKFTDYKIVVENK